MILDAEVHDAEAYEKYKDGPKIYAKIMEDEQYKLIFSHNCRTIAAMKAKLGCWKKRREISIWSGQETDALIDAYKQYRFTPKTATKIMEDPRYSKIFKDRTIGSIKLRWYNLNKKNKYTELWDKQQKKV